MQHSSISWSTTPIGYLAWTRIRHRIGLCTPYFLEHFCHAPLTPTDFMNVCFLVTFPYHCINN
ncbi:hypothetical protein M6B38_311545 [Iris pallida]|uniref:Uncharacterized protein n=1 Tax=Iris pallida TaxID=29817 RepID=A0AAX6HHU9_IRIPA|nr:hypothetical protein M6B38_380605 [Iris pallida]KAJ6840278.1 hypothetical protein M6B38_311545 [Iris pallida]